ncbi:LCP family protein [Romboutsia ilealis]|uniref:LCP family protein n=1 Tax=Romboutsia ilealis TaxID=1115758 RepID=UPI00272BA944|nr:LCP family protein [Romboutsia ilealis]
MARKKEKNENSGLKKLVIFLAILVIAFPVAVFGYIYFKLNTMHDTTADENILNETNFQSEKGITNILLAGTDGRPGEKNSRSDSMMILTVDSKNKSLKLTSLNRDTYVDIPGHGEEKLTHAYAYGGANLLVETIENNFEIDIQNYAVVDFYSFMDIVDALGGVEVDVHENEIKELNKFIPETYKWNTNSNKGSIEYINSAGTQRLNGYQTLSYARIRKNDSTQERDRRQRQVIEGLMNGVKDLPISKYPKLLDTILPYVKTNMKPTEIIGLAGKILGIGNLSITQIEFPFENASTPVTLPGKGFVIKFDESSLDTLHDFIFKNIIP